MTRPIRIGDTEPFTFTSPEQHAAWVRSRQRQGKLQANAAGPSQTEYAKAARLIMQGCADRERRLSDPVERARMFLQQRGWVVYAARVHGGPKGHFIIRGKARPFTGTEIVQFAEDRGWQG